MQSWAVPIAMPASSRNSGSRPYRLIKVSLAMSRARSRVSEMQKYRWTAFVMPEVSLPYSSPNLSMLSQRRLYALWDSSPVPT